ncbi:histidine kinase [Arsenicibacter rosenii]|uniref:Signal transduction histidine kinase internal region domain-containing protein n=1 Tax=Arsenicibacter rosenii TaxID=1750698 RepID=A0A1S2VMD0_9BACT|nr:histidine kinase [Arsenicibacter rosenii]OIN58948.1 hypothetical protein BLX24_12065 [Arsenicibacter rosenii]
MRLFVLVCLFCCVLTASADSRFRHLTVENGLPSNTTDLIFRDSRGFVWIGTNAGLVRFDGSRTRTYLTELAGKSINAIHEDQSGNLWIGTGGGLFRYTYTRDRFTLIQLPAGLTGLTAGWIAPFYIDNQQQLWFFYPAKWAVFTLNIRTLRVLYRSPGTELTDRLIPYPQQPFQPLKVIYSRSDQGGIVKRSIRNGQVLQPELFFNPSSVKRPAPVFSFSYWLVPENDSIVWAGGDAGLIRLNTANAQFRQFRPALSPTGTINHLTAFGDHQLAVSSSGSGLLLFNTKTRRFYARFSVQRANQLSIAGDNVNRTFVDSAGLIFCSLNNGRGVSYTSLQPTPFRQVYGQLQAANLHLPDETVSAVCQAGATGLLLGTPYGLVSVAQTGHPAKRLNRLPGITSLVPVDKFFVLAGTSHGLFLAHTQTGQPTPLPFPGHFPADQVFAIVQTGPGSWWINTYYGAFSLTLHPDRSFSWQPIDFADIPGAAVVNTAAYVDPEQRTMFVLSEYGNLIYTFRRTDAGRWKRVAKQRIDLLGQQITSVPNAADSLNLACGQGIFRFHKQTLQGKLYRTAHPLNGILTSDRHTWYLSTNGLYQGNGQGHLVRYFTGADGIRPGNYIPAAAMQETGKRWFFGSPAGLFAYHPAIKPTTATGHPQLTRMSIADQADAGQMAAILTGNGITLTPGQEDFLLDWVIPDPIAPASHTFRYRLDGYDKSWQQTGNPATIRYTNLPAGDFLLLVEARSASGQLQATRRIPVQVTVAFTKTRWYRALLVFLLLFTVSLIAWLRIRIWRDEQAKAELARLQTETELRALRAQINPHFVFNCMNTIDAYILTDRNRQASRFLQRFSKLIRLTLENSESRLVALSQEIRLLDLYIGLEAERFNNLFRYRILVSPELNERPYQIPPLLVQPFVENAILHGLRHLPDPSTGELTITIRLAGETMHVCIQDNGIGREASARLNAQRPEAFRSMGMHVTAGRIAVYQQLYRQAIRVETTDCAPGTRVDLWLPALLPS